MGAIIYYCVLLYYFESLLNNIQINCYFFAHAHMIAQNRQQTNNCYYRKSSKKITCYCNRRKCWGQLSSQNKMIVAPWYIYTYTYSTVSRPFLQTINGLFPYTRFYQLTIPILLALIVENTKLYFLTMTTLLSYLYKCRQIQRQTLYQL